MRTYELGTAVSSGNPYIRCLRCHRESYNPHDIEKRFCPNPKCGYHEQDLVDQAASEDELLAQLPRWTVLYNIVSVESDRFVGTGWEFFNVEFDASACYQRHLDAGNTPTKRPFNRKCDIPHLGAHHRYWIEQCTPDQSPNPQEN